MAKGKALAGCTVLVAGFSHELRQKYQKWLSEIGAKIVTEVSGNTTHVVASQNAWKNGTKTLDSVQAENAQRLSDGMDLILVVNAAWVEDSAADKKKRKEGVYLMEDRVCGYRGVPTQKRDDVQAPKGEVKKGGARNAAGMMKETLLESTEIHVDEAEAKRQAQAFRKLEMQELAKAEEEQEQKREAEIVAKGAKRARNNIFTENHRIFTDKTGFKFDVILTKVDTRANRNERNILTLFESNATPLTYAVNLNWSGTMRTSSNNLLAALGSNYPTAFRVFCNAFKTATGVDWDDRIVYHVKRFQGAFRGHQDGKKFEDLKFEYHPPTFGTKGEMTSGKKAELGRLFPYKSRAGGSASTEAGSGHEVSEDRHATAEGIEDLQRGPSQEELERMVDTTFPFEKDYSEENKEHTEAVPDYSEHFGDKIDASTAANDDTEDIDFGTDDPTENIAMDIGSGIINATEPASVHIANPSDLTTASGAALEGPNFEISHGFTPDHSESQQAQLASSFIQPPETVDESFRHGSQHVSETQIADRAKGAFEEFAGLDDNGYSGAGIDDGAEEIAGGGSGNVMPNFGSSILGKRKGGQMLGHEAAKKARLDYE